MNICDWIERGAETAPDKTALHFEGSVSTYFEFARSVEDYADQLQLNFGVERGDRVAFLGLNSPDFLFLMFACARIGAMIAPLNWRLARTELSVLIRATEPRVFIADPDMQSGWTDTEEIKQCALVSMEAGSDEPWRYFFESVPGKNARQFDDCDNEPLLLVYTSGTSGQPKGALLSHNAILANARNSQVMHQLDKDDHSLISLPFFHVGGLNILTTPTFFVGGTVSLQRTFDPEAMLTAMTDHHPTRVPIVSAQMPPILSLPGWSAARFPKLKSVTTGASPVSPKVYSSWRDKDVTVLQVYGATETCPIAIATSMEDVAPDIRSTGREAAGCEVRIVDDNGIDVGSGEPGEILIRGDNVMTGYWRNDAATEEVMRDGWYSTGDLGYKDEQGYYYIVDRKKDLIISGGENIFPGEIEKLLLQINEISDVAVIGKPDDRWGEVPVAVVALRNGCDKSSSDILDALRGHLGQFKIPKAVIFVESFPRNANGKIQKFILREQLFRE